MFIPSVLDDDESQVETVGQLDEMVRVGPGPARLLQNTVVLLVSVLQHLQANTRLE